MTGPGPAPSGPAPDVVGIGEAMVLLLAADGGELGEADMLQVGVAGAELNVCVAVAALGGRAGLCSRVGGDGLGRQVLRRVAEHGVDTGLVAVDSAAPTGVLLRDVRPDGLRRVRYDRADSAASRLDTADADRAHAVSPRAVVVSGLTVALGPGPARCVDRAVRDRHPGTLAVIDANMRPQLGPVADVAGVLRQLLAVTDVLKLGTDEGGVLLGTDRPAGIVEAALAAGVRECLVTAGHEGAWVATADTISHAPATAAAVVDPVGAGDALLGAYTLARLRGLAPGQALRLASQVAARVVEVVGDLAATPLLRGMAVPWRAGSGAIGAGDRT